MLAQWDCFLKNLGEWHGSFTRFSPQGEVTSDTPTLVTLEGLNNNQNVHQVVRYLPTNEPPRDVVVDYDSLNRSILFFENGAFSQGSMQWGPYSTFGTEFGLIDNQFGNGDRRLRMVELYNTAAQLERVVLIREKLPNSNTPERPTLTIDSLLGNWQGEAVTLYADLSEPTRFSSQLQIEQRDSEHIEQSLSFSNRTIKSTARIDGSKLLFENSDLPTQILLLPDGASSNCPLKVKLGHNFVLEMGWLLQPNIRQRIIRSYNAQGNWVSCTLVTEKKVG
ncbi:DUF3598 family protein [Pleurocapsales cyanobacterium LEGE 10410]|nr:DUF3598 family protein [Pleurocapsales cyanobacterium LEGE 10410]